MKLTLFSQNLLPAHLDKIKTYFDKPLSEVRFLYINTAGNYKPYKSEWMTSGEKRWQEVFPIFQEFDIERAYRVDNNFDFKTFISSYDYIFVGGGNIFLLSYWMNKTGAKEIIKGLVLNNKVIYGGASAGAVFTMKDISFCDSLDEPTLAKERINNGLGLLDFVLLPHWNNPEMQTEIENIDKNFKEQGTKTYRITDDQALFTDSTKVEVI
ncbi:MAG: Type 1 glutamine amidotransferase-like domain-containing protein [Candidatus Dojkabacteria bacterium]